MAVSTKIYGNLSMHLHRGLIDFEDHTLKAMLCNQAYTPNQDAHQFKNSVNNEVVGSGYVAGGKAIAGIGLNYDGSSNTFKISASNLLWPAITVPNIRYIVVYDDSYSTEATKPLILYVDLGVNYSPTAQNFYYNWPSGTLLLNTVP